LWDYLLTTVKVFLYLGIGMMLQQLDLGAANYLAAALVLVLTVVAFSSIGIIAASFIMVLKRGDPIAWFFSAISGLLGGVYYPLEVMPGWMQWLARWLPITYALEAMRKALLLGAPITSLLSELLILGVFCCVLLPLSLYCFRYAVNRAKIEGSLSHY
jgi:ABC-2 type transport system permease protein